MSDLSIGRLRGGFCVYWNAEDGKRRRHQLTARTRKEAEAEAVAVFRKQTIGSTLLVKHLWEDYRKDLGAKPAATTLGYTGKAVLDHFGAHSPDTITREICRKYEAKRRNQGISVGSIHTELGHLQSALNWAVKKRVIFQSPHIWRPSKPETDKRILSKDEAKLLIASAHDPHIRLAITLLLGTGARVGALLDLAWDRVDLEAGVINLRLSDSVTRKGRAIVPMNQMVKDILSQFRPMALTDNVIEYAGGPVKSIRTGFVAAVNRARLGHVRIHDLRHTAAVTMLSQGIPIEKVAQMLGHSNVATTFRVYGRYLPGHMQDAANLLDFG